MQYQVPQFIDVEEKIVGPLTLKQFMFLAGGGIAVFVIFSLLRLAFAIMLALPLAAIAGALAFGKVNGMPLPKYIASFIGFALKPQEYTWKKKQ